MTFLYTPNSDCEVLNIFHMHKVPIDVHTCALGMSACVSLMHMYALCTHLYQNYCIHIYCSFSKIVCLRPFYTVHTSCLYDTSDINGIYSCLSGDDFPNVLSLMEAVFAAEEALPSSSSSRTKPGRSVTNTSSTSEPATTAAAAAAAVAPTGADEIQTTGSTSTGSSGESAPENQTTASSANRKGKHFTAASLSVWTFFTTRQV